MRVAELSTATGVSVPTIKYYLREGLLPAGELTSPNQASYDHRHVRRLRLIRALMEVGGLSVARLRDVLAVIDKPDQSIHKLLGAVQVSLTHVSGQEPDEAGVAQVDALIRQRGWRVGDEQPARQVLAGVLTRMHQLGMGWLTEALDVYADAVELIAEADLDLTQRRPDAESMAEVVVVGTLLGDAALAALRRLADEDASNRRFGSPSQS